MRAKLAPPEEHKRGEESKFVMGDSLVKVIKADKKKTADGGLAPEVVSKSLVKDAVGRWGQQRPLARLIPPVAITKPAPTAPTARLEKTDEDFELGDLFATEAG